MNGQNSNQETTTPGATPAAGGGAESPETPAAPPITPAELEDLRKRAAKADEHLDRLMRTMADFENYKKRAAREKQDTARFANESLLQRLIPVLDSFDMALAAVQGSRNPGMEPIQAGISMVQQQFKSAVAEAGLEEIEAGGQMFDPNIHEAVSQQDSAEAPEGQVLQQLRRGYRFRERLLRPASVIIARKPAA